MDALKWYQAPCDGGQMIDIAYASDIESEQYVRRIIDHSDGSRKYEVLDFDGAAGEWAPWNGAIPTGDWRAR